MHPVCQNVNFDPTLTRSSTGQSEIRVLKDDAPVESTEYNDREVADSDKQLGTFFHIQRL